MNDLKIIDLYFERSQLAIEETAVKYGKYCYSISYNILTNKEDAEECVNDTWLDTWNSIPPHRPSSLSLFLGKLTRRISIDRWRMRNSQKRGGGEAALVLDELLECIPDPTDLDQIIEQRRLTQTVNLFIKTLPLKEQQIFLCRYWYVDSVNMISKSFGISEGKVKHILKRARDQLRDILIKEGFR